MLPYQMLSPQAFQTNVPFLFFCSPSRMILLRLPFLPSPFRTCPLSALDRLLAMTRIWWLYGWDASFCCCRLLPSNFSGICGVFGCANGLWLFHSITRILCFLEFPFHVEQSSLVELQTFLLLCSAKVIQLGLVPGYLRW